MPLQFARDLRPPPPDLIQSLGPEMVRVLRAVLLLAGVANVTMTSWYRDPDHNRRVGGASASQHQVGTAVDVIVNGQPRTVSLPWVQAAARRTGAVVPATGSATSGRSVHIQAALPAGTVQRMLDRRAGGIRI